jgi:DNA repair protein RadC
MATSKANRLKLNALSDIELMAIFLGTGANDEVALKLSSQLLEKHKDLVEIARLRTSELEMNSQIEAKFTILQAAIELGRRYYLKQKRPSVFSLSSSKKTKRFLIAKMADFKQEVFSCIFLNAQHQILLYESLFFGTITKTQVYPRIIAQKALEYNAAAVIFAHNHPSGDRKPSQNDIITTNELIEILKHLDILVLDHFVIANNSCTSFAELGLL